LGEVIKHYMDKELYDTLNLIGEPVERKLYFLGWLNRKLEEMNVNNYPVLVGGSAVAFYTAGNYATQDIDLCYSSPRLDDVLLPAGFSKEGRYWLHEELKIIVECPGSNPPERFIEVELDNGSFVYVTSIEDIIIDRLCGFALNYPSDSEWAYLMLESESEEFPIDWQYLEKRAEEEGVAVHLQKLRRDRNEGLQGCEI
jgi:hypothetical protein